MRLHVALDTVDMDGTDAVDVFADWLRSWGAADDTVSARVTCVRAALRQLPDAPSTEDLAHWLARPDFKPWTRVTYFSHLRSYYRWLYETGRAATDPARALRTPRTPRSMPRPLSDAEVDRALEGADDRMRAWLLFGLYAGLRAHETAKLHRRDIRGGSVYVEGKGGTVSYLPLHPLLVQLLDELPHEGWLFPGRPSSKHFAPGYLSNVVSRYFDSIGIEGSYHRCRHTYATRLLRAGVNVRVVQSLMRHSQLTTTAAYLLVEDDERAAAVNLLAG